MPTAPVSPKVTAPCQSPAKTGPTMPPPSTTDSTNTIAAAATAGAFGVVALPQTFFLNAQHKIVDRVYGAVTTASLAKGVTLMGQPAAAAAAARSPAGGG